MPDFELHQACQAVSEAAQDLMLAATGDQDPRMDAITVVDLGAGTADAMFELDCRSVNPSSGFHFRQDERSPWFRVRIEEETDPGAVAACGARTAHLRTGDQSGFTTLVVELALPQCAIWLDTSPAPHSVNDLTGFWATMLIEQAGAEPGSVSWKAEPPLTSGRITFTTSPAQIARLRRAAEDAGISITGIR